MKLTAQQMRSLPDFFKQIHDPRRAQGRRHYVHVVLAISAGAVLCGMRSYKAIADWAKSLSPTARDRFGCRFSRRKNSIPSESTIRNVLIRVDPVELDQALQAWNAQYGVMDDSLAIDGKTLTNRTLTFKALFPTKIYLAKAYPAIPPIDKEIRIVRPAT